MTLPAQDTAPADVSQGVEPEAPAAPEGVQAEPTVDVQPAPDAQAQPDGGQGLIASYLEGVDETHRDVVADALERYRQDSDARVTKKFERLNSYEAYGDPDQLETPVALYENLMEKPLDTLEWILGQFQEAGIDLRAQLLEEASATPSEAPAEPTDNPDDRPLTVAEWQRLQEEQAATQAQQAEAAQRRKTAEGWFTEATKAKGLDLSDEDIAVKQAILQHAAQIIPKFRQHGDEAGKYAIATAVEAFVNRFGKSNPAPADPSTEPKLADGGTPPSPPQVDLTDQKARRAYMLQRLKVGSSQE